MKAIIVTALCGLISSIVMYKVGKNSGLKERNAEKRIEKHELILKTFNIIQELNQSLYKRYNLNFKNRSIDDAVDEIKKYKTMYQDVFDNIEEIGKQIKLLRDQLFDNNLYLDDKIKNYMESYVKTFEFRFDDDGGYGAFGNYYEKLFENLISYYDQRNETAKNITQRVKKIKLVKL